MKIRDVVVIKEVVNDLKNGKHFYDRIQIEIGDYFWDCLVTDIESLFLYAGIHKKRNDLYQMLSKRFPYSIYYDIKDEIASVVAVLPMRRNPVWIQKKLRERM